MPSKSTKPPIVKTNVLTRHIQGASNSLIAEELNISRPTVQRILEESEIDTIVKQGRSRVIQLIPKSIDVVDKRLDRCDGSVAISLLRGTQVLQNDAVTNNTQNNFAFNIAALKLEKANQAAEQPAIELEQPVVATRKPGRPRKQTAPSKE